MRDQDANDKEAKPISCHGLCVHYWTCHPWVNPVLCTKIELRRDIKQFVDEKVEQARREAIDATLMAVRRNYRGVSWLYHQEKWQKMRNDLLVPIKEGHG